jgi:hypothetical protein
MMSTKSKRKSFCCAAAEKREEKRIRGRNVDICGSLYNMGTLETCDPQTILTPRLLTRKLQCEATG